MRAAQNGILSRAVEECSTLLPRLSSRIFKKAIKARECSGVHATGSCGPPGYLEEVPSLLLVALTFSPVCVAVRLVRRPSHSIPAGGWVEFEG